MIEVMPSIGSIVVLLTLHLTIMALLGMQLLGGRLAADGGHPRSTYDNFGAAFLTSFQVMTGENWNEVMYTSIEGVQGGNTAAIYIYFIFSMIAGHFVLLNLFLAIAGP
jgi:voltage-dependent calcium channel L type alpha-1D